jgi:hypothetical protein
MTDSYDLDEGLWTEDLRSCPTGAAQVDLSAMTHIALARGRRRRHATRGASALAGVAAVAGAFTFAGLAPTHSTATLGPSPATTPVLPVPVDPTQTASYWHVRVTEQATGQAPITQDTVSARTPALVGGTVGAAARVYHDGYFASGSDHPSVSPTGAPSPSALPSALSWAQMWQLPRTADGLVGFFDAHETDARLHDNATLYRWAAHLLTEPAPQAVHLAAVDVLRTRSGAPESRATDARGRDSLVFTLISPAGQQLQQAYVDPATGLLNEMDYVAGMTTTGARAQQWIYDVVGTTDTPTAATTG